MSLIAGIVHLDSRPADPSRMLGILDTCSRHAPDGRGAWSDDPVSLGHAMRHTTPESVHESLPLASPDRHWAITADARIDNRPELFEQLGVPYSQRQVMPDSTLILEAWRQSGQACPEHLEGDFAFAVFDRRRRALHCVRSVSAAPPIYFVKNDRCFAFASLVRPLLALSGIPKQLDEMQFARRIARAGDAVPGRQPYLTLFAGVQAVGSATTLTVERDGTLRSRTWWRARAASTARSSISSMSQSSSGPPCSVNFLRKRRRQLLGQFRRQFLLDRHPWLLFAS